MKSDTTNPVIDEVMGPHLVLGVPYVGRLNQVGEYSYVTSAVEAALVSVMEYWYPGEVDVRALATAVPEEKYYLPDLGRYLGERFTSQAIFANIDELSSVISKTSPTPLITLLPLTSSQPQNLGVYHPVVVLGLTDSSVVYHDFWLGSAVTVTREEYVRLQNLLPEDNRNFYLQIRPADKAHEVQVASRPAEAYAQNGYLESLRPLFALLGWAELAVWQDIESLTYQQANRNSTPFFESVIEHPDFSKLPRNFQVYALLEMAEARVFANELDEAQALVTRALALNERFNDPAEGWGGFEVRANFNDEVVDRYSGPHRLQGDIYRRQGELALARAAYEEALRIKPTNQLAQTGLNLLSGASR